MKIVVRVPNWIGDSVMSIPAINCIAKNFTGSEIWIAARGWVKEIFYNLDFNGGVIELLKENSLGEFKRNLIELKRKKFDLGILFTNSFSSALLFYLARVPERWGYAKEGRRILLSRAISIKNSVLKHQIYYYLDLLNEMGLEVNEPEIKLKISDEERHWARETLKQLKIPEKSIIIGINPGAFYGKSKRWHPENFAKLADKYSYEINAKVLLFGSENEIPLSQEILNFSKYPIHNFTGKTSLRQLMALIEKCDLFITNDSGPMHIADALRKPVVAIFGPTDPNRTRPIFSRNVVIKKKVSCSPCHYRICPVDHKCMNRVKVEEVFKKSLELIK